MGNQERRPRHRSSAEIEFKVSADLDERLQQAGINARAEDVARIARRGAKHANDMADVLAHFSETLKSKH